MKATVCKLTPEHGRHLRQLAAMMEEPLEDTLARVVETGLDAIDSLDGLLWDWALEVRDDARPGGSCESAGEAPAEIPRQRVISAGAEPRPVAGLPYEPRCVASERG